MKAKVSFYFKDTPEISIPDEFIFWLSSLQLQYQKRFVLKYIFTSDNYLLEINQKFLNHDYYTDIITFDLSTTTHRIESELFISIDRVLDNANNLGVSFELELLRVMIHGVYHLLGFGDKTEDERLKMRRLEDEALSKITHVSRET